MDTETLRQLAYDALDALTSIADSLKIMEQRQALLIVNTEVGQALQVNNIGGVIE